MTFTVDTEYSHQEDCIFAIGQYQGNGHIAVAIYSLSEGPFANVTVNLDTTDNYPENFGYVDTNNFPEAEAIIKNLGIGKKTNIVGRSGFCFYPLYEFDVEAIKKYMLVN